MKNAVAPKYRPMLKAFKKMSKWIETPLLSVIYVSDHVISSQRGQKPQSGQCGNK